MKKAITVGAAAIVGAAAAAIVSAKVYDKVTKTDAAEGECCCDGGADACASETPDDGEPDGQTEEPGDTATGVDPDVGLMPGGAIFVPTQVIPE